jgi:hypothetical protein
MMAEVALVRELQGWKGFAELYTVDGDPVVVSTVSVGVSVDPMGRAPIGLVGALADYATSGEETMAFAADADGEVTDWGELAAATGNGSRDVVLEDLRAR